MILSCYLYIQLLSGLLALTQLYLEISEDHGGQIHLGLIGQTQSVKSIPIQHAWLVSVIFSLLSV